MQRSKAPEIDELVTQLVRGGSAISSAMVVEEMEVILLGEITRIRKRWGLS